MQDISLELQDLRYLNWSKSRKTSGTAGSFLKAYDDTGRRKVYYKLSDYDVTQGIVGHECINEIIAQRVLTELRIPHLQYTLLHGLISLDNKEQETWLCESYDFKEKHEAKLALEDFYVMQRKEAETPMNFCKRMHWEKMIYGMLVIDFLIMNRDRHGANIEVLMDRKNQSFRLAPLFDQGLSFVCRCRNDAEVMDFEAMKDIKVQSFFGSNSLFENLKMVPISYLKKLPSGLDRTEIFEGLDGIMSPKVLNKIWEILSRRWEYLDHLRNS